LESTFPAQSTFENTDIFETDNILVCLNPGTRKSTRRISVEVFKPLPREGIPAFLWDCTRNGGMFHGMFMPESPHHPTPDDSPDEEIPF
jgi:hypothetical protein